MSYPLGYCQAWVNNPGSVLSRNCARYATRKVNGVRVCSWHKDDPVTRPKPDPGHHERKQGGSK